MKSFSLFVFALFLTVCGWANCHPPSDNQKPTTGKPKPTAATPPRVSLPHVTLPQVTIPHISLPSLTPTRVTVPQGSPPTLPTPIDILLPFKGLLPILPILGSFFQALGTVWKNLVNGVQEILARFFGLIFYGFTGTPAIFECIAQKSIVPQIASFVDYLIQKLVSIFVPLVELPKVLLKQRS
ncbi:hypothetical protein WA026_020480 [Henosepilachna vigintioctopunctata]|uniref:Uncharacterized protein n=1 Tax=Henosepilachna vigintioctopunctata TaxID=420089 RepID=A0AAW1VIR9_9CUCU